MYLFKNRLNRTGCRQSAKDISKWIALQLTACAALTPFLAVIIANTAYAEADVSYVSAQVLQAKPMIRLVSHSSPREECWNERVVVRERHANSPTGAILGGIIGAAIGHEVGHHKRNKQVGAVAGALLGSTVGNDVSRQHSGNISAREVMERRCRTVYDTFEEEQVTGYRVEYRYNGHRYHTITRQHPGDTLKLEIAITPIPI